MVESKAAGPDPEQTLAFENQIHGDGLIKSGTHSTKPEGHRDRFKRYSAQLERRRANIEDDPDAVIEQFKAHYPEWKTQSFSQSSEED